MWVFATAQRLRQTARRWSGDEAAGWAAAWLSLLPGLCEVPSFGSEPMMNLPVGAALHFFVRAEMAVRLRDWLAGGVFVGLASLHRPQAVVAAVALGLPLLADTLSRRHGAPFRLALLTAGALLPWALLTGVYAALGELPALPEWGIAREFLYAGSGSIGFAWTRHPRLGGRLPAGDRVALALAAPESFRRRDRVGITLALLLWLTWIPVAGGLFYELYYYLQFVPPLALLGAPEVARLANAWGELASRRRRGIAAFCVLPVIGYLGYTHARGALARYPGHEPRRVELAGWRRRNRAPAEQVFVWGHYTPIYTLAQRWPGTRYFNSSHLFGFVDPRHLPDDFDPARYRSDRDVAAALADLRARRPDWFVDTAPAGIHAWSKVPLTAFPDLARYVEENFEPVARPGSAVVYRRCPPRVEP